MYVEGNPRTKKQLREWLASGRRPRVFSPGPFPAPEEGYTTVEGPHYPAPHSWYARVRLVNGRIEEVR